VLKGALIFAAWGAPLGRSTRDVDLLAYTGNKIAEVVAVFQAICVQSVAADGMTFDPATVAGETITEHAEYQGVRVRFQGHLGDARVRMQIDLGFGDVITPPANWVEYPSLLGQPRPVLRGYPPETVVAEKTLALVRLGTFNSRMKDFYDLWLLARQFDFDGGALSEAIVSTLAHRNTQISTKLPKALANTRFGSSLCTFQPLCKMSANARADLGATKGKCNRRELASSASTVRSCSSMEKLGSFGASWILSAQNLELPHAA